MSSHMIFFPSYYLILIMYHHHFSYSLQRVTSVMESTGMHIHVYCLDPFMIYHFNWLVPIASPHALKHVCGFTALICSITWMSDMFPVTTAYRNMHVHRWAAILTYFNAVNSIHIYIFIYIFQRKWPKVHYSLGKWNWRYKYTWLKGVTV